MKPTEIHCRSCATTKPIEEFYPYCINMDGITGKCKKCREATRIEWLKKNPGLQTLYCQRARKRDPEKHKKLSHDIYQRMVARGTRGSNKSRFTFGAFESRDELKTFVIEQRKAGRTVHQVAADAGVSDSTVQRIIKHIKRTQERE